MRTTYREVEGADGSKGLVIDEHTMHHTIYNMNKAFRFKNGKWPDFIVVRMIPETCSVPDGKVIPVVYEEVQIDNLTYWRDIAKVREVAKALTPPDDLDVEEMVSTLRELGMTVLTEEDLHEFDRTSDADGLVGAEGSAEASSAVDTSSDGQPEPEGDERLLDGVREGEDSTVQPEAEW